MPNSLELQSWNYYVRQTVMEKWIITFSWNISLTLYFRVINMTMFMIIFVYDPLTTSMHVFKIL